MLSSDDPRRLIARLAVGMAAVDGRVTAQELVALEELDLLGLGHLAAVAQEELLAAVDQPIDVRETCKGLASLGAQTGTIILTVLGHVAASDGTISSGESEVFRTVAACLGVPGGDAATILDAATVAAHARRADVGTAGTAAPQLARAGATPDRRWTLLGLAPGAAREQVEAAYLAAVVRYDPAKLIPLGAEFVALAIDKLAEITEAYRRARSAP